MPKYLKKKKKEKLTHKLQIWRMHLNPLENLKDRLYPFQDAKEERRREEK